MGNQHTLRQREYALTDLAVYLVLAGIMYKFFTSIANYFSGADGGLRYDIMTFLMPAVFVSAVFLLINDRAIPNRFFGVSLLFNIYAVLITIVNGNYAAFNLVFVLINITYWFAVMHLAYRYKRKHPQTKWIVWGMAILLVFCFVRFIMSVTEAGQDKFFEDRDILTNTVYYILFLFPIVLLLEKAWLRRTCMVLIFVASVVSNKRGALIVLLLVLLTMSYFNMKKQSGAKKIGVLLVYALIAVGFYSLFSLLVTEMELPILERFEIFFSGEDTGSGRLDIWKETFDMLGDENILFTLAGRGYRAVSVSGQYSMLSESHNDMLQILVDYGVIGLLLLFAMYKALIGNAIKMYRSGYRHTTPYIVSLIIFFFCSMVSQVIIYPYWFLGIALFWGYTLADFENRKEKLTT